MLFKVATKISTVSPNRSWGMAWHLHRLKLAGLDILSPWDNLGAGFFLHVKETRDMNKISITFTKQGQNTNQFNQAQHTHFLGSVGKLARVYALP